MGNSNFWLWQTSKKRNCWASEGFHLDEGRFWRSIDEVRNYGWLQTSISPPKKSQIDTRENQKKNHFPMPFRLLLPAYIVAVCISLSSTSVIILYEKVIKVSHNNFSIVFCQQKKKNREKMSQKLRKKFRLAFFFRNWIGLAALDRCYAIRLFVVLLFVYIAVICCCCLPICFNSSFDFFSLFPCIFR